jgi:hypothetical protein
MELIHNNENMLRLCMRAIRRALTSGRNTDPGQVTWKSTMKPIHPLILTTILLLSMLCTVYSQNAAHGDRNSVTRSVVQDSMAEDSPVDFPKLGTLPAKYPADLIIPAEQTGSGPRLMYASDANGVALVQQSEPIEKDYYIFSSAGRSLEQIQSIQAEMPAGEFTPTSNDWKQLVRVRRILSEGGPLHIMAVGDSILNDTMRSGWITLLREAYPKADIRVTVYVRGGGGCQHYRDHDRVAKYILPRNPDLVFLGGSSQQDTYSIAVVIDQIRAALPNVEILLGTGAFCKTDPRNAIALAAAPYSGTGDYGTALRRLAADKRCAYLDFTTPWAEYIISSKRHPHCFYRDPVHANEYGEQILAKIIMDFFKPCNLEIGYKTNRPPP